MPLSSPAPLMCPATLPTFCSVPQQAAPPSTHTTFVFSAPSFACSSALRAPRSAKRDACNTVPLLCLCMRKRGGDAVGGTQLGRQMLGVCCVSGLGWAGCALNTYAGWHACGEGIPGIGSNELDSRGPGRQACSHGGRPATLGRCFGGKGSRGKSSCRGGFVIKWMGVEVSRYRRGGTRRWRG